MNELNPNQIDQMRFDQNVPEDPRKPLRRFVDDKLIPYGGMAIGAPLALGKGLVNMVAGAQLNGRSFNVGG